MPASAIGSCCAATVCTATSRPRTRSHSYAATAISRGDGSYPIVVPPATYRVFVRDQRVLSAGLPDRVRIDPGPQGELVGIPVLGSMPLLDATTDTRDVDLSVVRTARLIGKVI